MVTPLLSWAAVGLVGISATGMLLARDWRWNLAFMAAEYLGAAVLSANNWPLGMAAALLVTGWMSVAALGMTLIALPPQFEFTERALPQGRFFRLFMAGMIFVLAAGLAPRGTGLMEPPVIAGAVLLSGIGCLQLGTSAQVARIVLGLLTALTGFEVLYSAVEGSILVAGMLSAVMLGLGLVGAYLLNAPLAEDSA